MADSNIPKGGIGSPLSPYQVNVTYSASQGISRGTGADWFGPLNPLSPIAPWNRPRASGEAQRLALLEEPADWPKIVTRPGSPPKPRMLRFTQPSAAT